MQRQRGTEPAPGVLGGDRGGDLLDIHQAVSLS
jgi:hypothetical protein